MAWLYLAKFKFQPFVATCSHCFVQKFQNRHIFETLSKICIRMKFPFQISGLFCLLQPFFAINCQMGRVTQNIYQHEISLSTGYDMVIFGYLVPAQVATSEKTSVMHFFHSCFSFKFPASDSKCKKGHFFVNTGFSFL